MAMYCSKQLSFLPLSRFSSIFSLSLMASTSSETLVSNVATILREQHSKSRWNHIKSMNPSGFSSQEVSEIILKLRNKPHLALRFFLWSEKNSLCKHDLISYSTIIHVLARSRHKSIAQNLIQTAIRITEDNDDVDTKPPKIFETLTKTYRTCDSAPFVFDLLIKACLQSKKNERAINIVRMLRSSGISPLVSTCNSLLRSVAQWRGPDVGFVIYKELFCETGIRISPTVQTFNTLLISFYRDGRVEKLEEIRNEMARQNCNPNVLTYCILMAAFCDNGSINDTLRLWDEMLINKLEPDVVAYNTLMKGFCLNGKLERAEKILQEMVSKSMHPTCITYEQLIQGYCQIGDVNSAVLLYNEMLRNDFKPEISTIDSLIRELCNKQKAVEGLGLLRNAMEQKGVFPSRASYEFLIKGFIKQEKLDDALRLQAEMVGQGYKPDSEIYSSFIEGFQKQGDLDKVIQLQKEILTI